MKGMPLVELKRRGFTAHQVFTAGIVSRAVCDVFGNEGFPLRSGDRVCGTKILKPMRFDCGAKWKGSAVPLELNGVVTGIKGDHYLVEVKWLANPDKVSDGRCAVLGKILECTRGELKPM